MTGTPTPLDDPCNCLALRRASRYLTATYDKALGPVGLRATQLTILQKLAAHEAMTISSLADMISMDRTTMATNLKPLARRADCARLSRPSSTPASSPGPSEALNPKLRVGRRTVPVPDFAVELLTAHREAFPAGARGEGSPTRRVRYAGRCSIRLSTPC
ncbi:MarR family winged helix-turn-helix transcriptional regulator [Micromonospora sp. NPDC005806]|uniref:MarR family winged helix-turn-helix transcriptional regulator n=1 Tax=Micromonospora sp. NPDC005806 TaxID=3364234 RepID=UPI003676E6DC